MAKLCLKHISKTYQYGIKAIKDISLEVEDGALIAILGPSGCGKSTLLRMVAGLESITSGECWVGDEEVNHDAKNSLDVSMMFQTSALFPHMTNEENIAYGLKRKRLSKVQKSEKISEVSKLLQIQDLLKRKPASLSGGQKQRVALARSIVGNPKILLMDEPLSDLDEQLSAQMCDEIAKIHQQLKNTILYVTHNQEEAMKLADKLIILKDGVIQQFGNSQEIYYRPANQFVAQFIGSPQMNFIQATLITQESQKIIEFENEQWTHSNEQNLLLSQKDAAYTKVIVGIRPEHLSVGVKTGFKITGDVLAYDELGSKAILKLLWQGVSITALIKSGLDIKIQQSYSLYIQPQEIYLFDAATQVAIL